MTAAVPAQRTHRKDIQGLRAIAVLAVVAWHLDPRALPGGFAGVDVFFVVSGFLMTRWLVERHTLDRAALADFWARRCRRILPAATLVLLVTLVAGWIVLPATRRPELSFDALWSALYVVNLHFAQGSTDYLQSFASPSPFQHYWSLAVEEQFYLLWPLLMAAAAVAAARWRRSRRLLSGAIVVLVIIASAVASIVWTATDPASAYFTTPTRLWELALGGLVAVVPALRGRAAGPVALTGVLAAVASFAVLHGSTPFPGVAAWWPTLATALVLWAGGGGDELVRRSLVHRALAIRPVQWVGAISYSVYLWHWPVIVLANPYDKDTTLLSWRTVLIVAVTLVLAWLTWRLVEEPLRSRSPRVPWASVRGGILLGAACLATTVLVVGAAATAAPSLAQVPDYPGPAATAGGARSIPAGATADAVAGRPVTGYVPAPEDLHADLPASYADGCHVQAEVAEPVECRWGDDGPLVVVVGDSHATQWVPTAEALAEEHGWRVLAMTKAGCPFTASEVAMSGSGVPYSACMQWNAAVAAVLEREQPALVITSNAPTVAWDGGVVPDEGADASLGTGMATAWGAVLDRGARVAVMRDTPAAGFSIDDCVREEPQSLGTCEFDRGPALERAGTGQEEAARLEPRAALIDLNDAICGSSTCYPVIDGVVVFRDAGHLTGSYARTLADHLERELEAADVMPTER
ncbi:acyltransferase family protein [Agrococcus sp. Marseille-P2731]|uniref:acyltransferase family protein n=1 Tax=Agrococcus sp. Marseille-P2731 TaxID=1841862 RepID=UPI0013562BE8|nr:acyltransferase family protein [Agrococcus sp. Marseille-P2731]